MLLNIDPLFDAQGKLVGAINCFQDVTERKRMIDALDRSQHDLREQEERWAATYEHAAIGIVEIDAEGRFLRVNEAICSIVGGTREELLELAAVRRAPIPTTATSTRSSTAGRWPATSASIRSRSASSARTAA